LIASAGLLADDHVEDLAELAQQRVAAIAQRVGLPASAGFDGCDLGVELGDLLGQAITLTWR
jgi:hypothetical protein